ncbi:MAG: capsular polysaccharide biosynthesis protein [Lysobacteraceae bacterium]|nr:MAG: capsular polysaccharide biosynthesis protein [Xanthomonadaceae bacterium]
MTVLGAIRSRMVSRALKGIEGQIACDNPDDLQLRKIRQLWSSWRMVFGEQLPADAPTSLEDFFAQVPTTDRQSMRALIPGLHGNQFRSTGGSTGEPLKFPVSRAEIKYQTASVWWLRARIGISPADRLAMLWGHSHMLKTGISGLATSFVRRGKDQLLGYLRCSAYDLSGDTLAEVFLSMKGFSPDYILGYSAALERLTKQAERLGLQWSSPLKAVIATGECFPTPSSRISLSNLFGCPVLMEYGCVEAGTIAHELGEGDYAVMWPLNLLECLDGGELAVTALYPRTMPLLRYRLGDTLTDPVPSCRALRRIGEIAGRLNQSIKLPTGVVVHSEAVAHCVRDIAVVDAYQLVIARSRPIALRYVAARDLSQKELITLQSAFAKVSADLASIEARRVSDLPKTVSGKTQQVVYE